MDSLLYTAHHLVEGYWLLRQWHSRAKWDAENLRRGDHRRLLAFISLDRIGKALEGIHKIMLSMGGER